MSKIVTLWPKIAQKGGRHAADRFHAETPVISDEIANSFLDRVGEAFARQMLDAGVAEREIIQALDIFAGSFADRLAILEGVRVVD